MDTRSEDLLEARPQITTSLIHKHMSSDERFQNLTLRPVIKLQDQLLTEAFKNYIRKHKGTFYTLNTNNKMNYIENAIQRDIKFRNSLKGMIIGQFTIEEYLSYINNSSALNKRMMNMVIEILKDRIILFEKEAVA